MQNKRKTILYIVMEITLKQIDVEQLDGKNWCFTIVAFYISGFSNPSVAICQLAALSLSLTFLRLYVLRTVWHMNAICVVYRT